MSRRALRFGISPCPNDTFAFHALLAGEVETPELDGLDLRFELADVEELNRGMISGRFDAAKVSCHAALAHAPRWVLLDAGWALGFGVGPVVLAPPHPSDRPQPDRPAPAGPRRVLCPGRWTTAALLWRLFHREPARIEHRVFSEILTELEQGKAERGVCIHEARFVWRERGLRLVEDLGETWERATGLPLPLGAIAARRELGPEAHAGLRDAVRRSIEWAHENREACLPTMRTHAQEQEDSVLWAHVELYVNRFSRGLDRPGHEALEALAARAPESLAVPEIV